MQAEEELDFLAANHGAEDFHFSLATGADERVLAPDLHDQFAPEGAQGADAFWRWRWQDEQGGIGRLLRATSVGVLNRRAWATGFGIHAPPFVRVEAIVAHGVLILRRNMLDGGGDEIGGFEDLVIFLGVPTALGSVDDFSCGFVPGDFLE